VSGFSSRTRARCRQQAAAAERRDDRVDVGQVFENLEAAVRVAGDERSSSNGWTKWPVMRSEPCDSTVRQHSS
jgi:hypothetical protein